MRFLIIILEGMNVMKMIQSIGAIIVMMISINLIIMVKKMVEKCFMIRSRQDWFKQNNMTYNNGRISDKDKIKYKI